LSPLGLKSSEIARLSLFPTQETPYMNENLALAIIKNTILGKMRGKISLLSLKQYFGGKSILSKIATW